MDFFSFIVQALGILGMTCAVISQQCRRNLFYFLFQAGCSTFFLIQFLLTQSYTGMILNLLNILRSAVMLGGAKCKKTAVLILFELGYVAATAFSVFALHDSLWLSLLVLLAQVLGTLVIWSGNGKWIRYGQLTVISPPWLIYDAFAHSVGGVLCEVFNIVSTTIALIRYRKTGFEK